MTGIQIIGIVTAALSAISIAFGCIFLFQSWKQRVKKAELRSIIEPFEAGGIMQLAKSSMREELSEKEREVITRMLWKYHQVSLTWVLSDPKERYYLIRALSDPSKFPWEDAE